ncbi:MAG: 16S rRNA (cytosine(1402)-N(4))-methyltransferase, partial [Gemmatimonadetes bacterium]|nr:16S rRNA (cytosine(1402)-N(4))-methyltransferase [Gemmatimonadota bacterium]
MRRGPAPGPVPGAPRAGGVGRGRLVPLPRLRKHRHPRHLHAQRRVSYDTPYHAPVLVEEAMELLRPERGGLFLDGTLGGGGHAEALLERGARARLIGVDRDPDALA